MRRWPAVSVVVGALAACTEGRGAVSFSTYGEPYIEKEIPASAFEDGWTIRYAKFLVVLSEVAVAETLESAPVAIMPRARVFDMHAPGPKPVFTASDLLARPYTHVSYVIGPSPGAEIGEGASAADGDFMTRNAYGVYVEGTLSKANVVKRFRWGFGARTLYDRCEATLSGKLTEGVVVSVGGTDQVELTIHGDHLFYDDLQSPDAKRRADVIAAADADGDGEVTLAELASVELASLPPEAGSYGTGSAAGIYDVRSYIEGLTRTIGHFRGEGECFARPR